jgi:NADP-dependent 3-hydroxy acid dehydrogenase YdfG
MNDSVVVITGASAGIGAALAELLGQRGHRLVLVARRARELNEVSARSGTQAVPVVADVTKRADVERVLETALQHFGQVDVWVNNAGRGITKSVSELTDEDVDEMMLVNLKSALYGMQTVLPHFKAHGRGQIINVSSMLGRMPLVAPGAAYSASKHALNALTGSLRLELRETYPGIRVTSVHPGVVATEFGLNALHGGRDSRQIPGAQTALEVATVIADVIAHPRADVYTRPEGHAVVAAYYAAEDMAEAEGRPPFFSTR